MRTDASKAEMHYEDRCETIRYRLDNRHLLAFCTHGAGLRLYANSITHWKEPDAALSDEERLHAIKHMLEWMSRPGLVRRLLHLGRRTIMLVVDDKDVLRQLLEAIPTEMASAGIIVGIEHDSLQQRKDRFDAMIISSLKTGRGSIIIDGKKISTQEDFLAIEDRYERYFAPKSQKLPPSHWLKDTRKGQL